MAVRDAGWIQLYAENNQEVYDTCIQAFKISEHPDVQLPSMLMLDGFILSHTMQNVEVLPDEIVQDFVGQREFVTTDSHTSSSVPYRLDPNNPLTLGCLALYDYYFEIKRQQEEAIQNARKVIKEVNEAYAESFGRSYGDGLVEPYRLDDAELAIVSLGTTAGTTKSVVKDLRSKGIKAGLLRIRTYRPFPNQEIIKQLQNVEVVGVLDRSLSFGAQGGPIFSDVRNAFYDESTKPYLINYIYGLGGRDMTVDLIGDIYKNLQKTPKTDLIKKPIQFVGLRE
jgi:pyruvate ferredoxin oxidoreductase alpha subunit